MHTPILLIFLIAEWSSVPVRFTRRLPMVSGAFNAIAEANSAKRLIRLYRFRFDLQVMIIVTRVLFFFCGNHGLRYYR